MNIKNYDKKAYVIWYTLTIYPLLWRDQRGHDRMVFGFKTTYAISAYYH